MLELNFIKSADGLLPAVAQDAATGEVLMLAYINKASWQKTLETGKVHYWSRSRGKLWVKGETSGHMQHIKEIAEKGGLIALALPILWAFLARRLVQALLVMLAILVIAICSCLNVCTRSPSSVVLPVPGCPVIITKPSARCRACNM